MVPVPAFIPPNDAFDAYETLIDVIRNQYGNETDQVLITLKILTLVRSEETHSSYTDFPNSDEEYVSSNS